MGSRGEVPWRGMGTGACRRQWRKQAGGMSEIARSTKRCDYASFPDQQPHHPNCRRQHQQEPNRSRRRRFRFLYRRLKNGLFPSRKGPFFHDLTIYPFPCYFFRRQAKPSGRHGVRLDHNSPARERFSAEEGDEPVRMMDLINCLCNVIRAIYPILKDAYSAAKTKKADRSGNSDRKPSQPQG